MQATLIRVRLNFHKLKIVTNFREKIKFRYYVLIALPSYLMQSYNFPYTNISFAIYQLINQKNMSVFLNDTDMLRVISVD